MIEDARNCFIHLGADPERLKHVESTGYMDSAPQTDIGYEFLDIPNPGIMELGSYGMRKVGLTIGTIHVYYAVQG